MKQELSINGKHFSKSELLEHCNDRIIQSSDQWEKDVYRFILEWFDDKDFIIAHTSGSTGKPKEIVLHKEKMLASARLTGEYFKFQKKQSALLCLSANYIAGKMMLVRAIYWKLNLILVNPDAYPLKNLQENIDFAAMVPLQLANCLSGNQKIENVRNLLIGGGAIDKSLEEKLQELNTNCFLSYGMTETVSHVAIKTLNGPDKSNYFRGVGNVSFTIDNRSCLRITAPDILLDTIITNDIVRLHSQFEFEWLGRYDNVVNSGGVKLFPEQIEEKLNSLISEPFFLAGIPDEKLGEKLILLIEKEENPAMRKDLVEKMKGLLDKYEQARDIFFIPKFCRTPNGKIQRLETLSFSKIDK